ncbi:Phosphoenolpyruvate/pyruvate domain-containing protein [Thozetella sp. PMI_491]|nr:Phosphoenolpyruvate/pyruvate domain-containing protein [Thozetella sp. PMI_491]
MADKPYLEQPNLHTVAPHRAALLSHPANLREALREAMADSTKTLFGLGCGIPSSALTKVFLSAKPDFIWFDAEHGFFDRLTLNDLIQTTNYYSEGKTMAIVRVPHNDDSTLLAALDAGAAGILLPHCEDVEEVKKFIRKIYYPPLGDRSFSPWGLAPGVSDVSLYSDDNYNMKTANQHIAIFAQIESVKGVQNVNEIAAIPEVHGIMFGPGDYSADAGLPPFKMGSPPHPDLLAAMGETAMAAGKVQKPMLGLSPDMDMIPTMIQQGFRCIMVLFDVWGIAGLTHGNLSKGRMFAAQSGQPSGGA